MKYDDFKDEEDPRRKAIEEYIRCVFRKLNHEMLEEQNNDLI